MSEKNVLSIEYREKKGSGMSRSLRRNGKVPAVVYGHGMQTRTLTLDKVEWDIVSRLDANLVELKDPDGKVINALIKDVQYDYLKDQTVHVDFQEVNMNEEITATIPIHTHGTAVGTSQGGLLEIVTHEIEVKCLPGNLPESLELDVTELKLDNAIHVRELNLPEGVSTSDDPEKIIVHVVSPQVEEESAEGAEEGAKSNDSKSEEG